MTNKKISPQAVLALKEALSVITWKKDDLRDFFETLNGQFCYYWNYKLEWYEKRKRKRIS